jgi:UDP-N-acetylglucosamine 4,6-dehydratase/5-epimerase
MNLLITGGTGTFGNAFIPEALACGRYDRIAIYSRDETKQHYMQQRWECEKRLRWLIGDVRDYDRLRFALEGVDHVVQAAALKHVPSGERNPMEHINTNVLGSQNIVMAAATVGVAKVMAVSTDKAVEPINLYGATKLCMERLFMAANNLGRQTLFSACRYGNVIGSRGSFIETLEKLRDEGARIYPLRSPDSTRFWIRPAAAARFVLDRLDGMKGGEIFVPKMVSSTVVDFARSIFPNGTPEIVGVPGGEKIHETLVSEAESQHTTDCGAYYEIRPRGPRDESVIPWSYTSRQQAEVAV